MSRTTSRLRPLAEYLQATANEIALDQFALRIAGMSHGIAPPLPRPSRWTNHAKRHPVLLLMSGWAAAVCWLLCGAVLFHLSKLIRVTRRDRTGRGLPESKDGYSLVFSTRSGTIIASALEAAPGTWISFPWVSPAGVRDERIVDAFSLLSRAELMNTFLDACRASMLILRRRGVRHVLQSYTAFDWLASRRALVKLDGPLATSEHFDRWAVLTDFVTREIRLRTGRHVRLTLVQHGAMSSLRSTASSPDGGGPELVRRLGRVTSLYAYDASSEDAFRRFVLTASCARSCSKHHFRPRLELTDWPGATAPRVLFVGHPLCEDMQIRVFERARSQADFLAIYKPHPTAGMSRRAANCGWIVVPSADLYPRVDLVVSYPSTLVIEYETLGVPAVPLPMDARPDTMDQYARELVSRVRHLSTSACSTNPSDATA